MNNIENENLACSLEELRQIYGSHTDVTKNGLQAIGFTFNLPRRVQWDKKKWNEQCKILLKFFLGCSSNCRLKPGSLKRVFERSQDGTPHMHGIYYFDGSIFDANTFMCDLYKELYKQITKVKYWKSIKWVNQFWFPAYDRVKTPLVCLQRLKTQEEYDRWILYISKYQDYSDKETRAPQVK